MVSLTQLARDIALAMMGRGGVREWEQPDFRASITQAAREMALGLYFGEDCMALPDNILVQSGTAIIFADVTDHAPATANNLGTRTAQLDLTSVADDAYRQSDKVDLGTTRAEEYEVDAALEFAATPTAGEVVEFWWAPSTSTTAGTGNPGNASGADSAYTGYSSNGDASIKQCQFIGDFVNTSQATGTVQKARIGAFKPRHQYGSLIVCNRSGAAMHSDAVEMSVRLTPVAGVVTD